MGVCECVPVKVLSGGDSEGVSTAARPQQQVSSLGLSLKQQLCLQTGHAVITTAERHKNTAMGQITKLIIVKLRVIKKVIQRIQDTCTAHFCLSNGACYNKVTEWSELCTASICFCSKTY